MRTRFLTITLAIFLCAGHVSAQIQPYAKNAWYWQYELQPLLLVGGSDRDNIFQWAGEGSKLTDHLDVLKECGGNYLRCTMSSREYAEGRFRWDLLPYPFARIEGQYDLEKWDEAYWHKLRTFLAETKKRGIIVQLELWDRWNESGDSNPGKSSIGWFHSPWNPNNNINYDWSDSPLLEEGKTDFYNAFHYAAVEKDAVLLPFQRRFVGKILDEVIGGGFDHVLFQIDNESGIGDSTLEPDPYWAQFVRDYGKAEEIGYELYVCTSRRFHLPTPYKTETFRDWDNPDIHVPILNPAFGYCDISQNNGSVGQMQYDNLIWFRSKVLEHGSRPINNVKAYHFDWPIGVDFFARMPGTDAEAGARLWRAVFGGAASYRFHRRTSFRRSGILDGFGLNDQAQQHLRSMRLFLEAVDLFSMEPHGELLSDRTGDEAYCLAEPGRQFAVFFTGEEDRGVQLNVSSVAGSTSLRWLNVAESRWGPETALPHGKECTLSAPGTGHWVAVLRAADQPPRRSQKAKIER